MPERMQQGPKSNEKKPKKGSGFGEVKEQGFEVPSLKAGKAEKRAGKKKGKG